MLIQNPNARQCVAASFPKRNLRDRALGLIHMSTFVLDAVGRECGQPHSVPVPMQPRIGSAVTVLLVDDDDQMLRFCRSLLTATGFTVLEADNGFEALLTSVQHQGAIDLLITDVIMPGISGGELGRAFNELWPSVRVLYVSGSPRETVGDQLPADCAFLAKPFPPDALVDAVGDAMVRGYGATGTERNLSASRAFASG
jgi:CheY-like chemotaxis protein